MVAPASLDNTVHGAVAGTSSRSISGDHMWSIQGLSIERRRSTTPTWRDASVIAMVVPPFVDRSRDVRRGCERQTDQQILRLQAHYLVRAHRQNEIDRTGADALVHQPRVLNIQPHQGDDALGGIERGTVPQRVADSSALAVEADEPAPVAVLDRSNGLHLQGNAQQMAHPSLDRPA